MKRIRREFTEKDLHDIEILVKEGWPIKDIARKLDRSTPTIYMLLMRCGGYSLYSKEKALDIKTKNKEQRKERLIKWSKKNSTRTLLFDLQKRIENLENIVQQLEKGKIND